MLFCLFTQVYLLIVGSVEGQYVTMVDRSESDSMLEICVRLYKSNIIAYLYKNSAKCLAWKSSLNKRTKYRT